MPNPFAPLGGNAEIINLLVGGAFVPLSYFMTGFIYDKGSEPAISTLDKRTTGKEKDNKNIHNDLCVIGYLRPDYYELLSRENLLSEGRTFVFYYYAIKGESVYSHHEDI